MFAVIYTCVVLFTLLLARAMAPSELRTVCLASALMFGILWLFALPRTGVYVDTVRFFATLDATRESCMRGLAGGWEYLMSSGYDSTPVIGAILLFIAQLSDNRWLTFFAAFVDYAAAFFLIRQAAISKDAKKSIVFGMLFFMMVFNSNAAVNGVRNNMAGALAVCTAFHYLCKRSKRSDLFVAIACYAVLALIHPFVLLIAGIHLVVHFVYDKRVVVLLFYLVCLFWRGFQSLVINLIGSLSFIPFFSSINFKATQYFGEDAYIFQSTAFSRIRDILLFLFIAFCIIYCLVYSKVGASKRFNCFTIAYISFSAGSLPDEIMFNRCVCILVFVSLPFISSILFNLQQRDLANRWHASLFFVMVAAAMAIVYVDNMRAGVRFEEISFSFTGLIALAVGLIAVCLIAVLPLRLTTVKTKPNPSSLRRGRYGCRRNLIDTE